MEIVDIAEAIQNMVEEKRGEGQWKIKTTQSAGERR